MSTALVLYGTCYVVYLGQKEAVPHTMSSSLMYPLFEVSVGGGERVDMAVHPSCCMDGVPSLSRVVVNSKSGRLCDVQLQ